jgi:lysyl-tRNA synthetase class 1
MFWGDKIVEEFLADEKYKSKSHLIIRDEKTISGHPHVGSLRSFVMHATISDILTLKGVSHEYLYEINDTDAFDAVPSYAPTNLAEHLGKPLFAVPSPEDSAENFARYFADFYMNALKKEKYRMSFYFNSDVYKSGKYDPYIKKAIENKDLIRKIYKEVSGGEKPETWYPLQVICDNCGRVATTKINGFDGQEVSYECTGKTDYTQGCGFAGKKSPFGGNATLPWKVEWAAKFAIHKVDLEGAGKDHYAAGGSRHVANRICEEVFQTPHPFDVRHEFILIEGAKMSSSKGVGMTAFELSNLLPTYLFRFLMIQKEIMKTINFSPDGDTIAIIYDQYDEAVAEFLKNIDDPTKNLDKSRLIELTHFFEQERNLERFLPRFSQLAFLTQIPYVDIYEKLAEIKGAALSELDREEIDTRIQLAQKWLKTYSPERYKFEIKQDEVPKSALEISSLQKSLLGKIAEFLKTQGDKVDGESLHGFLHDLKRDSGCKPMELFVAIYQAVFGRESGPKAGFLLSTLDKNWLIERFEKVAQS